MLNIVPDNVKAKQIVLFGAGLEGVKTLMLTPIGRLYDSFSKALCKETSGWWKTGYFSEDAAIVKCPTGKHSEDAVFYAAGAERIILLGYCGACNPEVYVGDIFMAERARDDRKVIDATYPIRMPAARVKSGLVYNVETMNEQEDDSFGLRMMMFDADCIDMETFPVFSMAAQQSKIYGALYVVTDNIAARPFYRVSQEDMKRISDASDAMAKMVLEEILG